MENKDWKKQFNNKFPNKLAEVIDDFGSTVKTDLESFIESLLKSKQEEIEKAMPEKKVSLIVMGFNGVTKKGVISEDGYEILCKEMEKRGYNQALDDLKPIISNLLK